MVADAAAPVIAIDGPSGSGKGTLASRLAQHLGFHLLDSGALYRLIALAARDAGIDVEDEAAVAEIAAGLDARFVPGPENEPTRVYLDDREVDEALRSESCGNDASIVAGLPAVRAALLDRQREFRQAPGLVADGRDMGTVVFPDATVKVFLTASPEERALRRHKQLIAKGINGNLARLVREIELRDARDRDRAIAPLKAADDAVVIDSSGQDINAVFDRAVSLLAAHGL